MTSFAGDKKKGSSILGPIERRFIDWAVPRLPRPLLSHHLTMVTLFWSAVTVVSGWLAREDLRWLHLMSVVVFGQWLTDSLDGSLGRFRKQGLVKWGFFMDHLLDLLFAGSVVMAYAFLVDSDWLRFLFMVLLLVTCAMMAVSFLSFAAQRRDVHGACREDEPSAVARRLRSQRGRRAPLNPPSGKIRLLGFRR